MGDHELEERLEIRSNALEFLQDLYTVLHYYSEDEQK